jgi:hypothetical protein
LFIVGDDQSRSSHQEGGDALMLFTLGRQEIGHLDQSQPKDTYCQVWQRGESSVHLFDDHVQFCLVHVAVVSLGV